MKLTCIDEEVYLYRNWCKMGDLNIILFYLIYKSELKIVY